MNCEDLIRQVFRHYRAIPNKDGSRAIALEINYSLSVEDFKAIGEHLGIQDDEEN